MKKGALKMEVCRMLSSVAKNIEDGLAEKFVAMSTTDAETTTLSL